MGVQDSRNIALAEHATHALNVAIRGHVAGLHSSGPVHAVTSVTEHNSVLRPLRHLEADGRVRLTIVPLAADGSIDEVAYTAALKDGAKLVVLNHSSNVTGRPNDVARLFAMAQEAGAVTLLDASQSIGHAIVDVGDLQADMVAVTGHKGLHGPPGTGALYVSPGVGLEPLIVGGSGSRSDLPLHPTDMPQRLEAGTPNVPAFEGLAVALDWIGSREPLFLEQERRLGRMLADGLRSIAGVTVYGGTDDEVDSSIASFRVEGWDVFETAYVLEASFGIMCRAGLHCAPLMHQALGTWPEGTVRYSVSGFTTEDDVLAGLDAVAVVARSRRGKEVVPCGSTR